VHAPRRAAGPHAAVGPPEFGTWLPSLSASAQRRAQCSLFGSAECLHRVRLHRVLLVIILSCPLTGFFPACVGRHDPRHQHSCNLFFPSSNISPRKPALREQHRKPLFHFVNSIKLQHTRASLPLSTSVYSYQHTILSVSLAHQVSQQHEVAQWNAAAGAPTGVAAAA
jgi:hypothetical protein